MGIHQDNFTMLSELERLAAMVQDPQRRLELGAVEWPLAMMAFCLLISNDESRLDEALEVYPLFLSHTEETARQKSLSLLENFIKMRKGEGWRAFIPYALSDTETIAKRAAGLVILMAKPEEGERFTGVQTLVKLLQQRADATRALLAAIFDLADLRVEPLLAPLLALPESRLGELLPASMANRLSCNWILSLLKQRPELSTLVTDSLCAMANTPVVMDVVVPVPVWSFESPKVQPLHGWTPAEYFARMRPELEPVLSPEQLEEVKQAYQA